MTSDVTALTGVYQADGSLSGELRYVVGKLLGSAHCALCDITHGAVREKKGFAQIEISPERVPRQEHLRHPQQPAVVSPHQRLEARLVTREHAGHQRRVVERIG